MKRPAGVTIIASIAILYGILTLMPKVYVISSQERFTEFIDFISVMTENHIIHVPVIFQISHGLIGSIIWIIAGIFMFKGKNWARILALIWGLSVLLLTFFVSGLTLILLTKSAFYVLVILILMGRSGSAYFRMPDRGTIK